MRKIRLLLTLPLLQAASPAFTQGAAADETDWTPDAALIAKLEAGLKVSMLPGIVLSTEQLRRYDRYYTGVTVNGRKQISGRLIVPPNHETNPQTGVHITDNKYMPRLRGGGCSNITVTYYVDQDKAFGSCDLPDAAVPPSELPRWTPDAALAARIEAAMQDYLKRAYPDLAPLDGYSRYYWGVTIDGKPVVRGNVLMLGSRAASISATLAPGVHLASDWDNGPHLFDGGCSNIRIIYDVNAAKFRELACDGMGGWPQPGVKLP
jgi:hypothetical protein